MVPLIDSVTVCCVCVCEWLRVWECVIVGVRGCDCGCECECVGVIV